jgi:enoyl-CoA hydratase/carnithine racemase
MAAIPQLEQFRIEPAASGVVHLVFDMPNRSMNVFSNAAIHDLGRFAAWLKTSDARGVVVRSGKDSAFCAGADLGELGVAYDTIVAAPPADRFNLAFDHFFPLSRAIRALETSGKPVAAAIAGLALGGGCELALGVHHRVLADTPKAALGLPESLVGLLPGAGGTQRLPRLVGLDAALPVLLDGARLSGAAARDAGLVDEIVPAGEEVAAAEQWALSAKYCVQPWDRHDWISAESASASARIAPARQKVLAATLGHYPAPLAILDCIEQGLPQSFDAAIRTEMSIFAHLIQRPEPRNMIQTLFLGKLDYDRAMKGGAFPKRVDDAIAELSSACAAEIESRSEAMAAAGFHVEGVARPEPVQRAAPCYWFDAPGIDLRKSAAREGLAAIAAVAARHADALSESERRMVDYAMATRAGFPAYLGGPFALLANAAE